MKLTSVAAAVAAALIAAPSAMAQPDQAAALRGRQEAVPLRVRDDQVATMQQKLNDQGFDAGQVDGLWGPNTAAALRRYQARNGLPPTGQFDPKTLAALSIISPAAAPPSPQAQATAPAVQPAAPAATLAPAGNTGTASASGNSNQAIATTSANALQPAKGANSFTAGEAQGRIEREGYTQIADLKKDGDGVWRGHGMKNGASARVWLDYKGNVGQQ